MRRVGWTTGYRDPTGRRRRLAPSENLTGFVITRPYRRAPALRNRRTRRR
jgi:hypothetical protein